MYDSFYNLAEKPFGISTDPRFLWSSETHNEALANLKYGVMERNGFVVVTGDIGTGKTTLVNALLDMLSDDVLTAKINHPSLETNEFLTLVAKTFDPSVMFAGPSDLLLFFKSFLKEVHNDGRIALLIVDEAHRLSTEVLEEIRLLTNIEQDGTRLLNVILIGQKELKPILSLPGCRALQQRITLFYEIQLLSRAETAMYVSHRLSVCGRKEQLYTPSALQKIYTFSRGNPRLINILCNRALLTGYVKNRRTIDADIILECAREISTWHNSKSMFFVNTFQRISAGVHARVKALGKPSVAVQLLDSMLERLSKIKEELTKGMLYFFGVLTEKVTAFTSGLAGKYRRHLIHVVLLAGLASIALILTFGVLKGTDSRDPHSVSSTREAGSVGPTPFTRWSPLANRPKLAEKKPAASVETVGQQPPGQTKAPDTETFDPVPLTEHDDAPLMAAHEQLDPVELSKAALEQKDYQKALILLEARQGSRRGKDSSTSALYVEALVGRAGEIMASAPQDAEGMLWKAVEIAPDSAKAYFLLGQHYTKTKAYPRAIDVYRKAVHLDPLMTDAFFNLGYIYATIGNYEAAEEAFSRVVQLKPPYLDKSLFNLAVVQQKLGKKAESLSNLERAVTVGPENEKALAYLSRLKRAEAESTPVRTR